MNKTNPSSFSDTTLSSPNVKKVVNAIALILENQMKDDFAKKRSIQTQSDLFCFSEEKYFIDKETEFDDTRKALLRAPPKLENMEEFIEAIYNCTKFSSPCFIIGLLYINRLINFAVMPLLPENWRPIVFIALLLAQKVLDDLNYSNSYFCHIYPFFTIEEVNNLEGKFLELIDFKLVITSKLYAKYYFEISTLFKNKNETFPINPLDNEMADMIEYKSLNVEKLSLDQRKSKTLN